MVALAACTPGKLDRNFDRGRKFKSPLTPIGETAMSFADVNRKLIERQQQVKTLRANLDVTANAGLRGRQQFQTQLFVKLPDFMRVRGSQNAGTVFDILVNRQEVQVIVYPERRYYRGTLAQLQANPSVLGGLYPGELIDKFAVEQTLLQRIAKQPQPQFYPSADHVIVRFDLGNGVAERYHLRRSDLLTDLYERYYGQQLLSSIKYWGYDFYQGGFLLPSQFTAQSAGGGQFNAKVTDMRLNEPVPPQLAALAVPEGFTRHTLGAN